MNGRALARIAAVLFLFVLLAPIHIVNRRCFGRSPWPRRFLAASAWIFGARVQVRGRRSGKHALLISNHVSWLDILILGGSTNGAFVSKDQLGHPMLHWLADQNGTVYVKRAHRKGAKDQAIAIAEALERDKPIILFPEGTTGPGTHLLPFRPTLLEAANYAARNVSIRPVAIDYGDAAREICWWHDPGKANVLKVLGRRGTLPVTVTLLDPLERSSDRKQLAHKAREAIAERLGLTLHPHSPIGGEK